jgi:hypothetical protein
MALYGFIPPNKQKFYSARLIHVPRANDVNVVYTKNFGVTVVAIEAIIIVVTMEQHDVAMRGLRIYDILSPSNIIRGIVESYEVVVVDAITFEENRTMFLVRMDRFLHRRSRSLRANAIQAIQNVVFQPWQEALSCIQNDYNPNKS